LSTLINKHTDRRNALLALKRCKWVSAIETIGYALKVATAKSRC